MGSSSLLPWPAPSPRPSAPTSAPAAWWWAATLAPAAPCFSTPSIAVCWPPAARSWTSGILPTPTIQVYVGATRARGGIALTASHNPPEYNALKLFNAQGLFFNHYERGELLDLYHQSEFRQAANEEIRGLLSDFATPPKLHLDRILKHVDAERIRARKFRVALDGVNGAGALMSCHFLAEVLGCELHAIAVDPTKPFPRVAEPRPDTLGDLSALVPREHCEIGFAQDPDGDRLAVADETGRVLDNDDVLALVVDAALERLRGDVVVNLSTSSVIDDITAARGRRVFRTPVGEANVVETMQAVNAVIGGEGSNGGIIFPPVQLCRDSYTGMAFLLDRMAQTGLIGLRARGPPASLSPQVRPSGLRARAPRPVDAGPGRRIPGRHAGPLRRPESHPAPAPGSTCAPPTPSHC